MTELYPKEVIKHFKNPKNVGVIKNADGVGKVGNIVCGDVMWLYIKVKRDKGGEERISDVKFQTFGCIVAIAVSSMLTEIVKNKTIEEAIKITKEDILKRAGKLPPIKIHCSVLAADALHEAIYDYFKKNNRKIPEELEREHKRIKYDLEILTKRHKEYVALEKNILEK
ncbi:MAG: iron-sulfur cluster assembly scaffold protein [Candidatus Parvarchaeota archaeon]|nr:iron-sulfur cluster assembly scaffold protein [Candidatus Jingweiarchaeum tengchongense]MCW1298653.1 iron-sulfur cluster assembly scaffold protein [Candidatus Jingweiarchaeum tengchongense]MCW1300495.1 iron-sulfur cluster assembly scaffold protein [Candidatus Jingweiarchaeum tengchongense]MCW1304690.1 iron-sulfur cluster assembly scaffold protein [Candidatus Jingweiarchaeum tengchongense]MCW1305879.1 iron-sulfur cluster assembly scaffold protein [Candidatus Jingweiarchaeum tengchongense]